MPLLLLGVRSNVEWIQDIANVPIVGKAFLFLLIFIPAVLLSFLAHTVIPGLHDDEGFTKAMLLLLPSCNLFMWQIRIRLYCFLLPSWIFFGVIAIIKTILLIAGIDNGQ
ncbi:hypothetical protein [Flavisolibacter tropicus]|uniref:Uncharacterized protein n=1 Tax=Flavisolibacter tropicus TaxID=1492898 RepID=A0A172TYE7_9BACT|nr:hypothetical protein [Flavisolibacter tropicus]ANE52119.1 hypothetical protein SY85_18085 [Flavisolibacter tropicus]